MQRIFDKIEAIRSEPEHVRMRYVFLSVAVSMALVAILWIFSVYEGIRSIPTTQPIIPEGMNLPKAPTLDELSKNTGLQKSKSGEEFFQSERSKDTERNDTAGETRVNEQE